MSLVDYASSSDDDDDSKVREEDKDLSEAPNNEPPPPLPLNQRSGSSSNQQPESASNLLPPSAEKLPDASLLFNSPAFSSHLVSGCDHSSRVAAAVAESASRKRDSNGMASTFTRSKVPKGTLPHSRNLPDTVAGLLVPPQLTGRSNVVTEDIGKLFVKRHADPSSH